MAEIPESRLGIERFEFQNWSVYQEAIQLVRMADELCGALPKERTRSIADQLRRASQSIPLNIAEGSARYSKADKINFLRIARGSVFECASILDVLRVLPISLVINLDEINGRLTLIGKMLSGFIRYLASEKPNSGTGVSHNP